LASTAPIVAPTQDRPGFSLNGAAGSIVAGGQSGEIKIVSQRYLKE
jgi:hypothetical protein